MTMIHVTRVNGADVYGHDTRYCDASGCSGHEMYYGAINSDGTVHAGDELVIESDDDDDDSTTEVTQGDDSTTEVTQGDRRCECGAWSGAYCDRYAPRAELVTVEYMPTWLRTSHTAAGNSGTYPHNGARRILVTRACADCMEEHDPDWVSSYVVAEGA